MKTLLLLLLLAIPACHAKSGKKSHESVEFTELKSALTQAGFTIEDVRTDSAPATYFHLFRSQPVDHFSDTSGASFDQALTLRFDGAWNAETPVLFLPEGYDSRYYPRKEFTGNFIQVNVEHRYYGRSIAASPDYRFLNYEQAAADHHAIVHALKDVLKGPWISTGVSKGGVTSLMHRYHYPDDVVGTVAHVAPLFDSAADARLIPFLETRLPTECLQNTRTLQTEMLRRRAELMPLMKYKLSDKPDNEALITMRFETEVVDYFFIRMQKLLGAAAPACGIEGYADLSPEAFFETYVKPQLRSFGPHYRSFIFQSQTQAGSFAFENDHLKDQLETTYDDLALLLPGVPVPAYDGSTVAKLKSWLQTDAHDVILVYGGRDGFTAAQPDTTANAKVQNIVLPDATHGSAYLEKLDPVLHKAGLDMFQGWITPGTADAP